MSSLVVAIAWDAGCFNTTMGRVNRPPIRKSEGL
jgi:hypothetical protein